MHFRDRTEAGVLLGRALARYRHCAGVVYALPRGGVVLGVEVARALGLPLDLVIPRKIGHPQQPEYAICAVGESGELACNEDEVRNVDPQWLQQTVARERDEARRRRKHYLGAREPLAIAGQTAIIVDDGIATGLTMEAAIRDLRQRKPAQIVVAVPMAPPDTVAKLAREVAEVVVLDRSEFYLGAVGAYYGEFPQVTDEAVVALLRQTNKVH
jgi:predicted phosphoribosyltransferase